MKLPLISNKSFVLFQSHYWSSLLCDANHSHVVLSLSSKDFDRINQQLNIRIVHKRCTPRMGDKCCLELPLTRIDLAPWPEVSFIIVPPQLDLPVCLVGKLNSKMIIGIVRLFFSNFIDIHHLFFELSVFFQNPDFIGFSTHTQGKLGG